ncbi:MAG: hypothetical protein WBP22_03060 [Candidatus Saccharimonas sp.]
MARLPQPGGDAGNWGSILNDFLSQSHNVDGTIKTDAVSETQLAPSVVTKLNTIDSAVTSVNSKTPTSGAVVLNAADVGALTQSSADSLYDTYGAAASAVAGASIAGPAGPVGMVWRGAYSNTTTYAANDAVSYNGSSFIATAGVTGVNPGSPSVPTAPWNTLSQIGTAGGTIVPVSRLWVSSTLTPSATANTNGATQTATADVGYNGFALITVIQAIFAGTFNAETATVSVTVTYSDGSNSSVSPGPQALLATAASTQVASSTTFVNLHKNGVYITSVSAALKSTIASSQVTATVKMVAMQA